MGSVAARGNAADTTVTAAMLRSALLSPQYFRVLYPSDVGRRNIPLAFGLSVVVPGLGQAYNRQWVKAAVTLGAEIAIVLAYTSWHNSGVQKRDAYQAMAHDLWNPLRYAWWLNDYAAYLNQLPDGRMVSAEPSPLARSSWR